MSREVFWGAVGPKEKFSNLVSDVKDVSTLRFGSCGESHPFIKKDNGFLVVKNQGIIPGWIKVGSTKVTLAAEEVAIIGTDSETPVKVAVSVNRGELGFVSSYDGIDENGVDIFNYVLR